MGKNNTFSKILASVGTALVWFPLLAPVLASVVFAVPERQFRFDYLMPAELFPMALVGGVFLVWAARRAHARQRLIAGSFGAAVVFLAGVMVVPEVTGLASGATQPGGWQWALVLAILAGYSLALVALGVGGVLLLSDLFKAPQLSTEKR